MSARQLESSSQPAAALSASSSIMRLTSAPEKTSRLSKSELMEGSNANSQPQPETVGVTHFKSQPK